MSDNIRPALTAEEWARIPETGVTPVPVRDGWVALDGWPVKLRPHALAALCLYGQPFGFTHQDLKDLRYAEEVCNGEGIGPDLASLIARIAALLPPAEPHP